MDLGPINGYQYEYHPGWIYSVLGNASERGWYTSFPFRDILFWPSLQETRTVLLLPTTIYGRHDRSSHLRQSN